LNNLTLTLSPIIIFVLLLWLLTLVECRIFVSAASDVDPDNVAGQKTAEPAVIVEDAAPQTTQGRTEGHPTVVIGAPSSSEDRSAQLQRGPSSSRGAPSSSEDRSEHPYKG